jgi:hypothetical protein
MVTVCVLVAPFWNVIVHEESVPKLLATTTKFVLLANPPPPSTDFVPVQFADTESLAPFATD